MLGCHPREAERLLQILPCAPVVLAVLWNQTRADNLYDAQKKKSEKKIQKKITEKAEMRGDPSVLCVCDKIYFFLPFFRPQVVWLLLLLQCVML